MKKYAFSKAYPIGFDNEHDDNHFYIHALAGGRELTLAVNVESTSRTNTLKYDVHTCSLTKLLAFLKLSPDLSDGIYRQDAGEMPQYLDYYEMGLVHEEHLKTARKRNREGNDLLDLLTGYTLSALKKPSVYLLAYGSQWGPKLKERDWTFGFLPGLGIHDIHCNQKSPEGSLFCAYDEPQKDGALFFADPDTDTALCIFTIFE